MLTDKDLDDIKRLFNESVKELKDEITQLNEQVSRIKSNRVLQNPDDCIDEFGHDYPSPWFGTVAPFCKKCFKQSNFLTYRYNNTGDVPFKFHEFGGNMMYPNNIQLTLNFDNKE